MAAVYAATPEGRTVRADLGRRTGVRVVDASTGGPNGHLRALVRHLCRLPFGIGLLVYISANPDRQALYDWVLRTAVVPAVRPDARYPLVKDRSIGPTGAVGPGVIGLQPARHHPSAAPLVVWALPKLPGWATSTTLQAAPGPQAGAAGINRVMETKERASRIHTDLCVLESNVLRLAACWDGELDPIGAFCQLAYLHEKAGSPDAAARSIRASVELIAGWKDS